MKITTRDFGEIEAVEKDIIRFKESIFGFEGYEDFIMLFDEEVGNSFGWLQSVQDPQVCFLTANPALLDFEYKPDVPSDVLKKIGGTADEVWLIMVAAENMENSTVNLKSPIVINSATGEAAQVILEDEFPVKHRIFGKESA